MSRHQGRLRPALHAPTEPLPWDALFETARAARDHAVAPYSGFKVGAAVLAGSGRLWSGCNIEISSLGLTCCAERVAVFKALSEGETLLRACAIVTSIEPPAAPCGACRQVLSDFGQDLVVGLESAAPDAALRTRELHPLSDLLPRGFRPSDLHRR